MGRGLAALCRAPHRVIWRGSLHFESNFRDDKMGSGYAKPGYVLSKPGKATFTRIPFLADLILNRQAGSCGGILRSLFLSRRFRVVDVLGEAVDDCFLAHMAFLGAFRCHCHADPPEFIACVTPRCHRGQRDKNGRPKIGAPGLADQVLMFEHRAIDTRSGLDTGMNSSRPFYMGSRVLTL